MELLENWDLQEYAAKGLNAKYQLKAVIVHEGNSLNDGSYFCYVREHVVNGGTAR